MAELPFPRIICICTFVLLSSWLQLGTVDALYFAHPAQAFRPPPPLSIFEKTLLDDILPIHALASPFRNIPDLVSPSRWFRGDHRGPSRLHAAQQCEPIIRTKDVFVLESLKEGHAYDELALRIPKWALNDVVVKTNRNGRGQKVLEVSLDRQKSIRRSWIIPDDISLVEVDHLRELGNSDLVLLRLQKKRVHSMKYWTRGPRPLRKGHHPTKGDEMYPEISSPPEAETKNEHPDTNRQSDSKVHPIREAEDEIEIFEEELTTLSQTPDDDSVDGYLDSQGEFHLY